MANNGRMLMHSAVSAELVVQAVPEAMVEQVEIHSRVSTSASLAEAEVSPASSKISSEVVEEASSLLMDSVPAISAVLMVLPVMVAALMGLATELVLISVLVVVAAVAARMVVPITAK